MLGSRQSAWSLQGRRVWSTMASVTGCMKVRPEGQRCRVFPHRAAAAVLDATSELASFSL